MVMVQRTDQVMTILYGHHLIHYPKYRASKLAICINVCVACTNETTNHTSDNKNEYANKQPRN